MAVLLALFIALRVRLLNFLFFSGTDAEKQWLFCRFEKKASLQEKQALFANRCFSRAESLRFSWQTGAFVLLITCARFCWYAASDGMVIIICYDCRPYTFSVILHSLNF